MRRGEISPCRKANEMKSSSFKVTVCFEQRPDGGLRAWSEDVPGLVLSHANIDGVLDDVREALKVILSHTFSTNVEVEPLGNIREALESNGVVAPRGFMPPGAKEYVAYRH